MNDFVMQADSFDECLHYLTLVLKCCINTDLVLNFKKCYFMVEHEVVLSRVEQVQVLGPILWNRFDPTISYRLPPFGIF